MPSRIRNTPASVFAAIAIAATLLVAFVAIRTFTTDAQEVQTSAIDLQPAVPAANTCNTIGGTGGLDAGDVQSELGNVPLNTPFNIEVLLDGVPPGNLSADDSGASSAWASSCVTIRQLSR